MTQHGEDTGVTLPVGRIAFGSSVTGACPGEPDWQAIKVSLAPVSWVCPVCRKGNAPKAEKCGHCAEKEPA